jgi:membrane dipeptidase
MYTEFLGEKANIETVCDHICHFLELDPTGRHIALGGDLDGCESIPEGMGGIDDYPAIAIALQKRGLDDSMIRNLFWNNALEVMRKCCT